MPKTLRRTRFRFDRAVALALAAAVVLTATPAGAAVEVGVVDDNFNPSQVTSPVGGEVHWSRQAGSDGDHNIRQDDLLFYSGPPTGGAIDFTATFSAGSYHYFCEEHGSAFGGMDGTVKAPVKILEAPAGLKFTVQWATGATDTGSMFDVQYRVGSGQWKNWRKDTATLQGVFGQNGNPVTVQSNKVYRFRARSQEGLNQVSDWSPVRSKAT
jgi:plastocyanin